MRTRWQRAASLLALVAVTACGGGGGGGSSSAPPLSVTPTPSPTPASVCSVADRNAWVLGGMREWYLFPETLPANPDPTRFATVTAFIDDLTAVARSQRRDRFFTHITSIAEETAFFSQGASAGFGIRLSTDATARRAFVIEAFEGAPGLNAGIDRGTEILAIGTDASNLRSVSSIIAAEGTAGVTNALGPSTAGVARVLQLAGVGGNRTVTVTKAEFSLPPVSSRYGARIVDDGGRRVGYLNLRTFISSADQQLRDAFATFRAAGVTDFVIDLRYNGGGLVSTAELMGDLLGGNRTSNEVFSFTSFRPEKSAENETRRFRPLAQSVSPVRLAFITTGSTASASELVINSFIPYFGSNLALVGSNTFGKPVGQIALDRAACDDRLRVVAFSTRNSANSDAYFDGLASAVQRSCRATDDPSVQLGNPAEAMLRQALDFLAGRPCTAIATGQTGQSAAAGRGPTPLTADAPSVAQREVPGLF